MPLNSTSVVDAPIKLSEVTPKKSSSTTSELVKYGAAAGGGVLAGELVGLRYGYAAGVVASAVGGFVGGSIADRAVVEAAWNGSISKGTWFPDLAKFSKQVGQKEGTMALVGMAANFARAAQFGRN